MTKDSPSDLDTTGGPTICTSSTESLTNEEMNMSNATQNLMNLDVDNSTEQEVQSDCQTAPILLPQQMQNVRAQKVRNSRLIAN